VPLARVTVPVGVPENCGLTVIVKVTGLPKTEGLDEESTVGVLAALLTVWTRPGETLVEKLASPL
jgi:hypothetical protein